MDPAEAAAVSADFAKAAAAVASEGDDATKALSRLLDVIGTGTVPPTYQIEAAIKKMRPSLSNTLLHQQVDACLGERLRLIRLAYNQSVRWVSSGVSGLVGKAQRDGKDRALKVMVATGGENTFFSVLREQEIAIRLTRAYEATAPDGIPVVKAHDWWRVLAHFAYIDKILGGDYTAASRAKKNEYVVEATKDLPPGRLEALNECLGLELEWIDASLEDRVLQLARIIKTAGPGEERDKANALIRRYITMCMCTILQIDSVGITHNDLHEGNVRMREFTQDKFVGYMLPGAGEPVWFRVDMMPAFTDFGRSFAKDILMQQTGPDDNTIRETFQLFTLDKLIDSPMARSHEKRKKDLIGQLKKNPRFDAFRLATAIMEILVKEMGTDNLTLLSQATRDLLADAATVDSTKLSFYKPDVQNISKISDAFRNGTLEADQVKTTSTYYPLPSDVYTVDLKTLIANNKGPAPAGDIPPEQKIVVQMPVERVAVVQ